MKSFLSRLIASIIVLTLIVPLDAANAIQLLTDNPATKDNLAPYSVVQLIKDFENDLGVLSKTASRSKPELPESLKGREADFAKAWVKTYANVLAYRIVKRAREKKIDIVDAKGVIIEQIKGWRDADGKKIPPYRSNELIKAVTEALDIEETMKGLAAGLSAASTGNKIAAASEIKITIGDRNFTMTPELLVIGTSRNPKLFSFDRKDGVIYSLYFGNLDVSASPLSYKKSISDITAVFERAKESAKIQSDIEAINAIAATFAKESAAFASRALASVLSIDMKSIDESLRPVVEALLEFKIAPFIKGVEIKQNGKEVSVRIEDPNKTSHKASVNITRRGDDSCRMEFNVKIADNDMSNTADINITGNSQEVKKYAKTKIANGFNIFWIKQVEDATSKPPRASASGAESVSASRPELLKKILEGRTGGTLFEGPFSTETSYKSPLGDKHVKVIVEKGWVIISDKILLAGTIVVVNNSAKTLYLDSKDTLGKYAQPSEIDKKKVLVLQNKRIVMGEDGATVTVSDVAARASASGFNLMVENLFGFVSPQEPVTVEEMVQQLKISGAATEFGQIDLDSTIARKTIKTILIYRDMITPYGSITSVVIENLKGFVSPQEPVTIEEMVQRLKSSGGAATELGPIDLDSPDIREVVEAILVCTDKLKDGISRYSASGDISAFPITQQTIVYAKALLNASIAQMPQATTDIDRDLMKIYFAGVSAFSGVEKWFAEGAQWSTHYTWDEIWSKKIAPQLKNSDIKVSEAWHNSPVSLPSPESILHSVALNYLLLALPPVVTNSNPRLIANASRVDDKAAETIFNNAGYLPVEGVKGVFSPTEDWKLDSQVAQKINAADLEYRAALVMIMSRLGKYGAELNLQHNGQEATVTLSNSSLFSKPVKIKLWIDDRQGALRHLDLLDISAEPTKLLKCLAETSSEAIYLAQVETFLRTAQIPDVSPRDSASGKQDHKNIRAQDTSADAVNFNQLVQEVPSVLRLPCIPIISRLGDKISRISQEPDGSATIYFKSPNPSFVYSLWVYPQASTLSNYSFTFSRSHEKTPTQSETIVTLYSFDGLSIGFADRTLGLNKISDIAEYIEASLNSQFQQEEEQDRKSASGANTTFENNAYAVINRAVIIAQEVARMHPDVNIGKIYRERVSFVLNQMARLQLNRLPVGPEEIETAVPGLGGDVKASTAMTQEILNIAKRNIITLVYANTQLKLGQGKSESILEKCGYMELRDVPGVYVRQDSTMYVNGLKHLSSSTIGAVCMVLTDARTFDVNAMIGYEPSRPKKCFVSFVRPTRIAQLHPAIDITDMADGGEPRYQIKVGESSLDKHAFLNDRVSSTLEDVYEDRLSDNIELTINMLVTTFGWRELLSELERVKEKTPLVSVPQHVQRLRNSLAQGQGQNGMRTSASGEISAKTVLDLSNAICNASLSAMASQSDKPHRIVLAGEGAYIASLLSQKPDKLNGGIDVPAKEYLDALIKLRSPISTINITLKAVARQTGSAEPSFRIKEGAAEKIAFILMSLNNIINLFKDEILASPDRQLFFEFGGITTRIAKDGDKFLVYVFSGTSNASYILHICADGKVVAINSENRNKIAKLFSKDIKNRLWVSEELALFADKYNIRVDDIKRFKDRYVNMRDFSDPEIQEYLFDALNRYFEKRIKVVESGDSINSASPIGVFPISELSDVLRAVSAEKSREFASGMVLEDDVRALGARAVMMAEASRKWIKNKLTLTNEVRRKDILTARAALNEIVSEHVGLIRNSILDGTNKFSTTESLLSSLQTAVMASTESNGGVSDPVIR